MSDGFFDHRPSFMCACGHLRRRHWNSAAKPMPARWDRVAALRIQSPYCMS